MSLAILFAVYGAVVLLSGRDPCHCGLHAIAVAGILSLLLVVSESPAKQKPEKYDLTQWGRMGAASERCVWSKNSNELK